MNGKKTNIRRKDFLIYADACGISRNSAEKMIGKLVGMKEVLIRMCGESLLPAYLQERFVALMEERVRILEG